MTPQPNSVARPSRRKPKGPTSDSRLRVFLLVGLALVQAAVVATTGSGPTRILAVLLVLPAFRIRLRTLAVLSVLIVGNFAVHSLRLPPALPLRLVHIAVFAAYGAVALAALIAVMPRVGFAHAVALTGSLAALVVGSEVLAGSRVTPVMRAPQFLSGTGSAETDDLFGGVYQPYGEWSSRYPDDLRGYLKASGAPGTPSRGPFMVTYVTNALGCRGRDYAIPNPRTARRILMLGGSGVFGIGVRDEDTLSEQLARRLGERPSSHQPVEVINCAIAGAGTREQRLFYEQVAHRYEPDIVILVMTERDNLSARDERAYAHVPGKFEAWSSLVRLLLWSRHEGARPFDYAGTRAEVEQLLSGIQLRRSRPLVALFRTTPMNESWSALKAAVTARAEGAGAPLVDLGDALGSKANEAPLTVHPLDPRPNHTAHRLAADLLAAALEREHLAE